MRSPRDAVRRARATAKRVVAWHSPVQWLVRMGVIGAAFLAMRQVIQLWIAPWARDTTQALLPDDPSWFDYAVVGGGSVLLAGSPMVLVLPLLVIAVVAPLRDPVTILGPLHRATVRRDQARLRLNAVVIAGETVLACDERGEPIEDGHIPTSKDACRDRNRRVTRRAIQELASAKADLERCRRRLVSVERREDRQRQRYLARLERSGRLRS